MLSTIKDVQFYYSQGICDVKINIWSATVKVQLEGFWEISLHPLDGWHIITKYLTDVFISIVLHICTIYF